MGSANPAIQGWTLLTIINKVFVNLLAFYQTLGAPNLCSVIKITRDRNISQEAAKRNRNHLWTEPTFGPESLSARDLFRSCIYFRSKARFDLSHCGTARTTLRSRLPSGHLYSQFKPLSIRGLLNRHLTPNFPQPHNSNQGRKPKRDPIGPEPSKSGTWPSKMYRTLSTYSRTNLPRKDPHQTSFAASED